MKPNHRQNSLSRGDSVKNIYVNIKTEKEQPRVLCECRAVLWQQPIKDLWDFDPVRGHTVKHENAYESSSQVE